MRKWLLILSCMFLFTLPVASAQSWWNASWDYRKIINITNINTTVTLEQNYTINVTLNFTQLILDNKMNATGNDTRIVWHNGTNNIELDRINTTPFYSNGSFTTLWFKLQRNISAGASDAQNYTLYYGNPSAGNPPTNGSNVYLFYDGFEDYNLGDLNGQGGWSGDSTMDVQSGTVKFGSKAAARTPAGLGATIVHNITPIIRGRVSFYMRGDTTNNDRGLALNSHGCEVGEWRLLMWISGGLFRRALCYTTLSPTTYVADQWYKLEFIFDTVTDQWISIKIDGVDQTPIGALGSDSAIISNLTLYHGGTASSQSYWDEIIITKYLSPEPSAVLGTEQALQMTILSPLNQTYATSSIWANVTLDKAGSWCGRSLDNAANVSLSNTTGNWNNLMSVGDGSHNVKFYCNNTSGGMNSTTQYFSVNTTPLVNISIKPSKAWWSDSINASGAILASGQSLSDVTITVELNNQIKCTDQTDASGLWTCTFNAPNEIGSYTVRANITLSGNTTSAATTLKVAPNWGDVLTGIANRFAHQAPMLIQEPSGKIRWAWVTVVVRI